MKNIVFQGDSITDFGRNYADPHNVGSGYVLFIQAILNRKYPQLLPSGVMDPIMLKKQK